MFVMERMTRRMQWLGRAGVLGGLLVLALGCRTPQPNLKPPTEREVMNAPPSEGRFNTPGYPKEAMKMDDPIKMKATAGGPGAPGMGGGGMPGMGGRTGR